MPEPARSERDAKRRVVAPVGSRHAGAEELEPRAPETEVPEWHTERWKHEVEAEARHKLKGGIRDVGRPR